MAHSYDLRERRGRNETGVEGTRNRVDSQDHGRSRSVHVAAREAKGLIDLQLDMSASDIATQSHDDTGGSESDPTWLQGSSDNNSNSTDGSPSNGMVAGEGTQARVDPAHDMAMWKTTEANHDMPSQNSEMPDHEKRMPPKQQTTTSTILNGLLIATLVIIAIFILLWLMWPGSSVDFSEAMFESQVSANLVKSVQKLKQSFPSQTERFWKTFRVRSTKHITSPKRPLVFMIAADTQTAHTSQCLARHLIQAANETNPLLINASEYTVEDGDQVKLTLDKTMKQYFDNTPNGTVVINHIELLPPLSPFLFYSYCDNDNALYPHSTVIFIAHITTDLSTLDPLGAEKAVEQFLGKKVWGNNPPYDPGAVGALLSRITDTVLVPRIESSMNVDPTLCSL